MTAFKEQGPHSSSSPSHHEQPTLPLRPSLNMRLVGEMVTHLSLHRGLDSRGRIHPSRLQLPLAEVETAIALVEGSGLILGLEPYHLQPAPQGTWQDPDTVREVLRKKLDQVRERDFGGDLLNLCMGLSQHHLRGPFIERVMDREVSVSMMHLCALMSDSPYQAIQTYLSALGRREEFSWLRPYHMAKASQGAYLSPGVRDELLVRWFDQLCHEKFGGNLVEQCLGLSPEHILEPYRENVMGRTIELGMVSVRQAYKEHRYHMMTRYLELSGKADEFSWYRPYHMRMVPLGTWKDERLRDETLRKKCEQVLAEEFGNDVVRFTHQVSAKQLKSPLVEHIAGRNIVVNMRKVSSLFNDSPRYIVAHFLRLREREK
jgi:hypothetical protein